MGGFHLLLVMCGVVILGACNSVFMKVTYTAYGDRRAFFVNQASNLLSIAAGGFILYPRMLCGSTITLAMRRFPKRHFVIMGFVSSHPSARRTRRAP